MHDRRKNLFFDDGHVDRRAHDGRLDEIPAAVRQHVAPVQKLCALALHRGQAFAVVVHRRLRDQRPHQGAVLQRVSDADRPVRGDQLLHEALRDGPLKDQTPRAGAPLACRADRPEHHRTQGQLEVRVGHHDHRVVSAKLEDRSARSLRDRERHTLPEGARAGRLDQRDPFVGEQRLADRAATSDDEAEDTLGLSAGGHAVEDLLGRDGDQRGQA